MAFNAKTTSMPEAPRPAGSRRTDDVLTIADLSFDHQVVVWALRSCLAREDGAMRVQAQLYRALPAAAARVAFRSVQEILETLQRHGTRPLSFRTLATDAVSRDEFLLLTLFCAVAEEAPSTVLARAEWLVSRNGRDGLIATVASLVAALAARHQRHHPLFGSEAMATLH